MKEHGRFLKKDRGTWIEVTDDVCYQKIAHAIQYRRRRSIKDGDYDGECDDDDEGEEITKETEIAESSVSLPIVVSGNAIQKDFSVRPSKRTRPPEKMPSTRKTSLESSPSKAKRRQHANDAARLWLHQAAIPLRIISSLANSSQVRPRHGKVDVHAVHEGSAIQDDELLGEDSYDPLPVQSSHCLLDCSDLYSLADILGCFESQEGCNSTITHRDTTVPVSVQCSTSMPLDCDSDHRSRQGVNVEGDSARPWGSQSGVVNPGKTPDRIHEQHLDGFDPYPMQDSVDPLDRLDSDAVADLLSCFESQEQNTFVNSTSIEQHLMIARDKFLPASVCSHYEDIEAKIPNLTRCGSG